MTIVVAIFAFTYLPSPPMDGASSLLFPLFTSRDRAILVHRVLADDKSKETVGRTWVQWTDIVDTFRDWRIYGHCASAFVSMYVFILVCHREGSTRL